MGHPEFSFSRIGVIGSGGMAQLSNALLEDGTHVVVRELLLQKVFMLEQQMRFRNGCRIREMLSASPHIVKSLGRRSLTLLPYEIIEYFESKNLKLQLNSQPELVKRYMTEIIRQAAEALAWVHENGYMHLDVKPENFLVSFRGANKVMVKLTDFDLTTPKDKTGPRPQRGTPAYMAPEQITRKVCSQASDVFAFSIMAYRVVTGKMPFFGNNLKQVLRHQARETVKAEAPIYCNPDVPRSLNTAIMLGLEKREKDRIPTMSEWLKVLESHSDENEQ